MIDHVSIPVRRLDEAAAFYAAVLAHIGYTQLATQAGTVGFGKRYPDFWLNHRPALAAGGISDGHHLCLRATSMAQVDAAYEGALALGARPDGAPGFREQYHETYYAAFFVDADGNRIEVVTFATREQGE